MFVKSVMVATALCTVMPVAWADPVEDLRDTLPVDPFVGWCDGRRIVGLGHEVDSRWSQQLPDGSLLAYDLFVNGDLGIFNAAGQDTDPDTDTTTYFYWITGYSKDSDCMKLPGEEIFDPEFELVTCIHDVVAVHLPDPPAFHEFDPCLAN